MADRVTNYAIDVVNGKYPVGRLHILACQRHVNDLARQNTEDFPYYWDEAAANKILDFAETLTISEGQEKKRVKLLGFQVFSIGSLEGWRNARGFKRFRRSYDSMARQNGKTFKNGILGTYISAFSGYNNGKLFTVATGKRQARIAWEQMKQFISVDKDLGELFTIRDWKSVIECDYTNSTIEALSKEAGLDDGFRSIFSSIDELHQHKDGSIYNAIYNGTRSLDETLISIITTRGKNLNSFAKEMDEYAVNILEGSVRADNMFVDIHALDPDDDHFDEKNLIKANPYLATTESGMESLREVMQTAKDMGGMQLRDYQVKVLNLWVENADDAFIDTSKWKENATDMTLEDFSETGAWVGLDLSSGGDLTSLVFEFEYTDDDGEQSYFIDSHSFMPRGRLQEHIDTDLVPYDDWEKKGLLTVTGGAGDFRNDYKFIIKHLQEVVEKHDIIIQGIAIDPHNADGIMADLEEFGAPILIVNQSARFMNDATVDFRLLVKSNRIFYNRNNELLTWSMANAKIVMDSMENIKVDKKSHRFQRIDPVDAVLDAHTMRMKNKQTEEFDATGHLEDYLASMGWN